MKLEWRRRSPARPWLLLRPGADGGWHWCLLESGMLRDEGQGRPPQDLIARVALVVPGEACSHFQLPAPPGLKREEWPLLLEDRLLQGSDEVHCACIGRTAGQLRLVVVARDRLDGWLAQCVEWGLEVERCWSQFQLLPALAPGCGWQWRQAHSTLYARVDEEGSEHWLAWPQVLGHAPAPWDTQALEPVDGRWPQRIADLDTLPVLRETRRPRQSLKVTGLQKRLVAACLVLAAVWGGLWISQQWRQAQLYRQQVLAVTGPQATPRQAAQALRRLRDADGERVLRLRRLDGLQGQLQGWLHEHPQWRLRAVRFDGQRWHLQLDGDGTVPPWDEMAATVGAAVQVQAQGVVFDLGSGS